MSINRGNSSRLTVARKLLTWNQDRQRSSHSDTDRTEPIGPKGKVGRDHQAAQSHQGHLGKASSVISLAIVTKSVPIEVKSPGPPPPISDHESTEFAEQ